MPGELIKHRNSRAVFAPQYFGSVDYYALLSSFGKVYVNIDLRADKRFKSAHRCKIVDTRDEIMLTVPVVHASGKQSWNDIAVSAHGCWWSNHLTALESAYGRTPFFDYYIDRFRPIFEKKYDSGEISVGQLDCQCDKIIREILGIDNEVVYGSPDEHIDFDFSHEKEIRLCTEPYYQIRSQELGFRYNLSILDLIFNVGPESPLYLHKTQNSVLKTR